MDLAVKSVREQIIIVPVFNGDQATINLLDFACNLGGNVTGLFISNAPEKIKEITGWWKKNEITVKLVILENPSGSLIPPLLYYLDSVDQGEQNNELCVVLPEKVGRPWWEKILQKQTSSRIKNVLMLRPGVRVMEAPPIGRSKMGKLR